MEGQLGASEAAVKELSELFIGRDPREIKRLVRGAYDRNFYHGGAHYMSALGGIEIALWDLAGKLAGAPVHRLLGGKVRDRVKVYRWAGGNNNAPGAAAEEAARVVGEGARAIKMNACPPLAAIDTYGGIRAAVERARAVREAVGPEVEIAFDFHGRCNVPMARRPGERTRVLQPAVLRGAGAAGLQSLATGNRRHHARPHRHRRADVHGGRVQRRDRRPRGAHPAARPRACRRHLKLGRNRRPCAKPTDSRSRRTARSRPSPSWPACTWWRRAARAGSSNGPKGIHYNASGATGEVDPWLRYLDERDWPMFDVDSDGHLPIPETPGLGIRVNWAEVEKAAKVGVTWRDELMQFPDGTISNW